MFQYRNILKQSLKISWSNKYLWFFGLFAAFLGSGGDFEIISRQTGGDLIANIKRYIETGVFKASTISNIGELLRNETASMLILLGVAFVVLFLIGFFIWLAVVSQAALVNDSAKIITGKSKSKSDIKTGIIAGNKNFWQVLLLNIIVKSIVIILFLIISLPILLMASGEAISAGILFIILFIVLVPIAIIFSFIIKYAICFKVVNNDGLVDSIVKGWSLFKKNWLVSVEMAFLLFFISFVFGLAIILAVLIITIPFLFLAFIVFKLFSAIGFLAIVTIGFILMLILVMIAGAMLSTFQTATWTGLYLELVNKTAHSKIVRSVKNLKK